MYDDTIEFIRTIYPGSKKISLHEPVLDDLDKSFVIDAIESGFVSSVGAYVDKFEHDFANATGAAYATATVNGTAAIHTALVLLGVSAGDEVLTQSLTFVATCNAITYTQAKPVFIDVDKETLGLCPNKLQSFLHEHAEMNNGVCQNKSTGATIRACLPMHTFGHACHIQEIKTICDEWRIALIEDSAEAVGSQLNGRHLGTFGDIGIFSFNGNKIITTGGGGMLVTDNEDIARRAKHLTTTARVNLGWEYIHDETGFNFRLPNLNASLGCAQLSKLENFIRLKRQVADKYRDFFSSRTEIFVDEPANARSNFWLNSIVLADKATRDEFLEVTNAAGIATRPIWRPMHQLLMYQSMQRQALEVTEFFSERIVNLPSSVPQSGK